MLDFFKTNYYFDLIKYKILFQNKMTVEAETSLSFKGNSDESESGSEQSEGSGDENMPSDGSDDEAMQSDGSDEAELQSDGSDDDAKHEESNSDDGQSPDNIPSGPDGDDEEQSDVSSEDDDESTNGDDESENEPETNADDGNTGWADAMAKVLAMGKNTDKPVSVLSKAKKDNVGKSKTKPVQKETLETNEASSDSDAEEDVPEPHVPISVRRAKKREIDAVCRVKPDITKRGSERSLAKIATRGVVQLFNAVREQQKSVKVKLKEAGNSRNREKILKNLDKDGFLAVLEGKRPTEGPVNKRPKVELKEEDDEQDVSTWSALKEDFMLGAKLKDWDKESDTEL